MWYGYIIVDYETITNKYHKMVHIPNFTTLEKYKDFGGYNYASGANSGFKWYNYNQNTSGELTLSNHMVADFEGICGVTPTFANTNYMRFDGHNIEFDTLVGDRGVRLSGGQIQRIAIARAIIRKPEILILDEATSAIDTKSEKLIQEAVEEISVESTIIVIAHRLSTIRGANQIYVLNQGEIVEFGNYNELLKNNYLFNQMVKSQEFS